MRSKSAAKRRPPQDDASSLVFEFVESVARHGAATEAGMRRATTREYKRYDSLRKRLLSLGEEGRNAFRTLMSNGNGWVRMVAASTCLGFAEDEAERTLEALGKEPGFLGHDAKWILREWRASRLRR